MKISANKFLKVIRRMKIRIEKAPPPPPLSMSGAVKSLKVGEAVVLETKNHASARAVISRISIQQKRTFKTKPTKLGALRVWRMK